MFGEVQIVQPNLEIDFDEKIISAKNSMIRSSRVVEPDAEISQKSLKTKEVFAIYENKKSSVLP